MFGHELKLANTWDPWRELSRLQNEVSRLFGVDATSRSSRVPAVNVWTNDDGAVLRALLPGFEKDNIDISVLGDSVTIAGSREERDDKKDATCHRREREYGSFSRTLQLPFRVEAEAVTAAFKNGVLELTLPRANADKPKRIAVKAS